MIYSLKILLAYLIPSGMGLVLLAFLERKNPRLSGGEKLALSFPLGSGLISFYLFYLGILRINFNLAVATGIVWPFLIIGIVLSVRNGAGSLLRFSAPQLFSRLKNWQKVLTILLGAILLTKIIMALFIILSSPTYFDDSIS